MLFRGDSAKGSAYDTNQSIVTRDKLDNKGQEFDLVEFWRKFNLEFPYLFPRQGKPEIELGAGTHTDTLKRSAEVALDPKGSHSCPGVLFQ